MKKDEAIQNLKHSKESLQKAEQSLLETESKFEQQYRTATTVFGHHMQTICPDITTQPERYLEEDSTVTKDLANCRIGVMKAQESVEKAKKTVINEAQKVHD